MLRTASILILISAASLHAGITCETVPLSGLGLLVPEVLFSDKTVTDIYTNGVYIGSLYTGHDGKTHYSSNQRQINGGGVPSFDDTDTVDEMTGYCGGSLPKANAVRPGTSVAKSRAVAAAGGKRSSGNAAGAYALGDFNGDGIVDLARTNGAVFVDLYGANGQVSATYPYTVGHDTGQIVVADFNGDGILDIAVAAPSAVSFAPGRAAILLGNGDGTFAAPVYLPVDGNPGSVAVADFNGDGKTDLAFGSFAATSGPGTLSILPGRGDGTFGAPVAYSVGTFPRSLLAADFNGDGKADLAVLDTNGTDTLWMFLGNGDGTLRSLPSSVPGTSFGSLAYTDLNNDGKQDLAISDRPNSGVVVLVGKGDGTFQAPTEYATAASPVNVALTPLRDGTSLVMTGDGANGSILMGFAAANGTLNLAPLWSSGVHQLTGIAVADLNGDGQPDVVTIGGVGGSPVAVMLSQGGGQFRAPAAYAIDANAMGAQAVAIGDLNGDGKPDVVVANEGDLSTRPQSLSVFLGNGDGTLKAAMGTPLPSGGAGPQFPSQVLALADFNGDGKLDAAVAGYRSTPDAGPGVVQVLLGKGDGTFQSPASLAMPNGLHALGLAAGDLNGDGIPDLVVELVDEFSSGKPASVAIFLGQAGGGFGQARTFGLQAQIGNTSSIAIGDLNGDGKPDLAVASDAAASPFVDILLGDGAGGFREATSLPATTVGPMSVLIADLNRDGKPDLVVGDLEGGYFLGNGDGTFQAERLFPAGQQPFGMAVTKLSGSQGPDLVVAHQNGSWLALANGFGFGVSSPSSAGPATGGGANQTFQFTFTDTAGYQNLTVVDVLINSALDGRHACYLAFAPSGANSGSLYLVDDAGDAGGPYQGLTLPGGGSISNSQCAVNGAASQVSGNGNSLTLTLAITFSAGFAGNKIFYLSAGDKSLSNSGWQALGTWSAPGGPSSGPAVGGMSPGRTSAVGPTTYTFTFTDTNGWQDIAVANVLINRAIDGRQACYLAFVPSGAGAGAVYLVDDAGDAAGPYTGTTLPGTGTAGNSQCTVGGAGASVMGSGNTLTLTLPITFTGALGGNQVFFLAARSNSATSNWQAVGSVSVP